MPQFHAGNPIVSKSTTTKRQHIAACKNGAQYFIEANAGPTSTPLSYGVAGLVGCLIGMFNENKKNQRKEPFDPYMDPYRNTYI
jgi:hypothetical protein